MNRSISCAHLMFLLVAGFGCFWITGGWMMVATVERQVLQRRAELQPPRELGAQAPLDPALEAKLVLVRGELYNSLPLLDPQFDLKQPALGLKREVLRFDGKNWVAAQSPKLPDQTRFALSAWLGSYQILESTLQTCSDWQPLPLTRLPAKSHFQLMGGEAVTRKLKPKKGDLRVRFSQLPNGLYTALGQQRGSALFGRMRLGSRSWQEMDPSATSMRPPDPAFVWVPRFFGWLLMSLGLGLSYPLAQAIQPKITRFGCFPFATVLAAALVALSVLCAPSSASPAFLGLVSVTAIPLAMILNARLNHPPDKPIWQD